MDLKEMNSKDVDWIGLVQDRDGWQAVVNAIMNLRFLQNAGNFLTSWGTKLFKKDYALWR
jgi:hypothetical protein